MYQNYVDRIAMFAGREAVVRTIGCYLFVKVATKSNAGWWIKLESLSEGRYQGRFYDGETVEGKLVYPETKVS